MLFVGLGIPTGNEEASYAESICESASLFDFEAVIVDLSYTWPRELMDVFHNGAGIPTFRYEEEFQRYSLPLRAKMEEATYLLSKGGVIVCVLRPPFGVACRAHTAEGLLTDFVSCYDWIPVKDLSSLVVPGEGVKVTRVRPGPFNEYVDLPGNTWYAYLKKTKADLETIAVNDANFAVAARWKVDNGSLFLIPFGTHKNARDSLVACVVKALKVYVERKAPAWMQLTVPGEEEILTELQKIQQREQELKGRREEFAIVLERLTSAKKLLYEQGEPLTDAVKSSLTELGFKVEKEGEKDLVAVDEHGRAIIEVTGSEGRIDIEKFRQLLDYLMTEHKEHGTTPKSILIGNHQINNPPEKRGDPFTDRVVQQSKVFGTCLLPTTELFKAVVLLRQRKLDAARFRTLLRKTDGVFSLQK